MNILEIHSLKKSYGDFTAVGGISLAVKAGEIHGILGPNGAGKSTTMNCILGLLSYEGKITFDGGKSIKEWNKNVGYVPQDLAIYPELTPTENVRFFCALYGFKGAELKEKVAWALDFVGLTDVKNKKSGEFSGGMKRRLNMACGIAHSPKLIIMDEPTVGIDPQSRNRIMENVKELNRQGAAIVYTTHYMPEVEDICSKITVIDHGTIVADGTKDEIMHKAGMSDASMEQIFLQLTGTDLRD
ncbi:MAG: ABC transporter ATP-binding protein [Bacteroides sp.]|nr:ABC transporter ATP-binding protein [Bacteroides sp.]